MVTEDEKPPFFENFDLTFEYSPYTSEEESFLSKWYGGLHSSTRAKSVTTSPS